MQASVTDDIANLGLSESEWNRTVSQSETNTIFQTYQWFHAWWKVFGGQHRLFFISLKDDEGIIGFAPLMITADNGSGRVVRFVGDDKADYLDFIITRRKNEVLRKILETVIMPGDKWDSILLNNIPEGSSTAAAIRRISEAQKLRVLLDDRIICPALRIKGHEQAAARIANKVSLRRRSNYFHKNGRLRFFHVHSAQEAREYLPLFFEQHVERWSITESPSLFLKEKNRGFYEELFSSLIQQGWLLFSVVEFDGRPIAFHFGFHYNGKLIWYKPSFDLAFAKRSPGKVLLHNLIKYSIVNEIGELDYTIGDEAFKDHFSNVIRKNVRLSIYRTSWSYYADYVKNHTKRMIRNMWEIRK